MISKEKLFLTICMGIIISFFLLAGPWTIISEGVIFPNLQAPIFQGIPFDNPHFPFEEDFFPPTQNPLLNWPSQPGFSFPGRGPFSNWANHPIFGPQSGMNFSPSWAGTIPQVMDILGAGAVVPVIDMATISNPLPRVDFNLGLPLLAKESMSPVKEASTASTGMQLQSETITANTESENTKPIPTLQLQHEDITNSQERIKRVNVLDRGTPVIKLSGSKPVFVSQHSTRKHTVSLTTSGKEEVSSIKSKRPTYREGEVLVRFREGVSGTDALNRIRSVYKLSETKGFPTISRIMGKEYMLVGQKGEKAKDLIEILKKDPFVERVSLNYSGEFFSDCEGTIPNDMFFDMQWSLCNTGQEFICTESGCFSGTPDADIDATEAWDHNTGSEDIVVAVVDTGVAYDHPELEDNMWTNTAEFYGDTGKDDDKNGYVDDIYGIDPGEDDSDPYDFTDPMFFSHGTSVAGVIGARGNNEEGISGVNWETRIMAIKVATADIGLFVGDVVEAVEYILYWKDKGENIVAMNASWGFYPEFENPEDLEILRDAIEALGREGIILVAAAGNDGEDNDDGDYDVVPASFDLPNIVAVASMNWDDYLSEFSNYGPISVDLGAPGELIMTTFSTEIYLPGVSGDHIFFDDMESGPGNWIADEPWEITDENYISPDNAWSDSPGGNYPNDLYSDLTTIPIDLSGESGPLHLGFWINFELEEFFDWLDIYFKVQKPSYWEITDENAHESTYAWSDSPNGNYPDFAQSWLVSPIIDLSVADFAAQLSFWLTGETEEWYDHLIVLYSNDGGASWDYRGDITGDWSDQWYYISDYIPPYYRTSQFRIAFVLESDFIFNYDGYYIDDVVVQDSSTVFFSDDMESGASAWSRPTMVNWEYQGSFTGSSGGWWGIPVPLYEDCYWNGFQVRFSTWYDFSINFDGVYIDDVGIGHPALTHTYTFIDGTSLSAPFVTGAAALLAAEHTSEGPKTIIDRILGGVDPLTSLQGMVATGGRLNLYNSITMEMPSILDQINNILDFFDQSVEDGRLWGTGPNSKVASQRIKTIGDQIERAATLIEKGRAETACGILLNIYNLTDGASAPPDFVAGPAATHLAFMILDLRINLGCP